MAMLVHGNGGNNFQIRLLAQHHLGFIFIKKKIKKKIQGPENVVWLWRWSHCTAQRCECFFCFSFVIKHFVCEENARVHDPEIPLLRPAAVTSLREEYSNFSVQYFIRTSHRTGTKEFR
jgi:hypothetical protein